MGQSGAKSAATSTGQGSANINLTQLWVMASLCECAALILVTCGYISLFDFGLQLPVPVGILAAIIVIAVYLALHGDTRTMLAMIFLLTPAWTLGIYFLENPQVRLHRPFLNECSSIQHCIQHVFPGENVKWGWALLAFFASVAFRSILYAMVRQRTENPEPLWEGVGRRTWMWLKRLGIAVGVAMVVVIVVGLILKAVRSEQ
jgi:hypothetical protein